MVNLLIREKLDEIVGKNYTFPVRLAGTIAGGIICGLLIECAVTSWDPDKKEFNVENISADNFLLVAGLAAVSGTIWEIGYVGIEEYLIYSNKIKSRKYIAERMRPSEYEESGKYYSSRDAMT